MNLSELKPAYGSRKSRNRVGRGMSSGSGKTCGRGHNGQKSRSGYSRKAGFEGGQMPLVRRVPKRGFNNKFKKEYAIVNIADLNRFEDGAVVDADALVNENVIKKVLSGVKILANGDLEKKVTVKCSKISENAKNKIEAAGGNVEVI